MHLETIPVYIVLFVAAVLSGLIDAIAGGGGLIALPALLAVGVPPQIALGTNKFQSSFGSFTASSYYWRKGFVDLAKARTGIVFTFIGAALGAWAVQQIQTEILNSIIPVLLFIIALYTILTPSLGHKELHPQIGAKTFFGIAGILFGFYDGFFGPGVGSFWAIAFVLFLGFDLQRATGHTKVMNFTSNIVSLVVFAIGGSIWFVHGIVMAVGQVIGARIGARLAVKKGIAVIRPLYIVVVLATVLKLLYDRFL
ncbi:MAG: TSUP family transporter [Ignavibacteriales bacterium]|nr:TSUP family transporter [Ignavibacteriales bacterium]